MFSILQPFLSADFIGKCVRHAFTGMTASLVTAGVISGDEQTQLVGAVGVIATVLWMAFAHSKAAAKYGLAPNDTTGGLL